MKRFTQHGQFYLVVTCVQSSWKCFWYKYTLFPVPCFGTLKPSLPFKLYRALFISVGLFSPPPSMLLLPYAKGNDSSTLFLFTVFFSMTVSHLHIPFLLVCLLLSPTPVVYLATVASGHLESNLASNQELRRCVCVCSCLCVSPYIGIRLR